VQRAIDTFGPNLAALFAAFSDLQTAIGAAANMQRDRLLLAHLLSVAVPASSPGCVTTGPAAELQRTSSRLG
jgi:hypothetical protein